MRDILEIVEMVFFAALLAFVFWLALVITP
jgi:hypothetical protein